MPRPLPTTPTRKATTTVVVTRVTASAIDQGPPESTRRPDVLVTEEPLQIMIGGPGQDSTPVTVTMRTPGHDFELAVGFCFAEGLLRAGDVRSVRYCEVPRDQAQLYNVVSVRVDHPVAVRPRLATTTAACGICGTASLDDVEQACDRLEPADGPTITVDALLRLPATLRAGQTVFDVTGGLHGAALADCATGEVSIVREDVGRHNAVDKVIGRAVLDGTVPVQRCAVLVVSGRTSFEIVQKAAMAGVAVVVAVSAPTSLAVDLAERLGVTLVGFVRPGSANVYTWPQRVLVT